MYGVFHRLFLVLGRVAFGLRVEACEHVPSAGPAILVARHRSWLDPLCVAAVASRPVRFLMMEKIYAKPWGCWFYRRMGAIPVAPGSAASFSALRSAMRALRDGEIIGIFPEGRVVADHEKAPFQPGAALLAVRSGAPVVPIVIDGSNRAWPHGRRLPRPAKVRVRVGPPLACDTTGGRDAVQRMAERIETALRTMA